MVEGPSAMAHLSLRHRMSMLIAAMRGRAGMLARPTPLVGYGLAVAVTFAALGVALALRGLTGPGSYSALCAAVAVSVWLGGAGPGIASLLLAAWWSTFFLMTRPYDFALEGDQDVWRWLMFLVAGATIVGLGQEMHVARRRAEGAHRSVEQLQSLTSLLLSAGTRAELASVISEHTAPAIGAAGGALALGRPDETHAQIVAPMGTAHGVVEAGSRIPLDSGLALTEAIRRGQAVVVATRAELERLTPLGARMTPDARSAIGVPLVSAEQEVIGSLALYFARDGAVTDEVQHLVSTVAALCQETLRRVDLYAAERGARVRTERLQFLTATLAGAMTERDVVEIAVNKVVRVTGSSGVTIGLVTPDRRIRLLARAGAGDGDAEQLGTVARDTQSALAESIRSAAPIWIETRDELERRDPANAVAHPEATAAAVLPLVIGERAVGALGIVLAPGTMLSQDDRDLLLAVAAQCSQALDRVWLYEEQHTIAQTLQQSLLPPSLPPVPGCTLASAYVAAGSANEVGGDFYDAFPTEQGLFLVVGDVCGKGPKAAQLTALCRYTLRAGALGAGPSPAGLLDLLNRAILSQQTDKTEYASVVCIFLEPQLGRCRATVASGGHPPLLVRRAGGSVEAVKPRGGLVGAFTETIFEETVAELGPRDVLLAYTDGVPEARRDGEVFGEDRLRRAVAGGGPAADGVLAAIEEALAAFLGGVSLSDDIALLALQVDEVTASTGAGHGSDGPARAVDAFQPDGEGRGREARPGSPARAGHEGRPEAPARVGRPLRGAIPNRLRPDAGEESRET